MTGRPRSFTEIAERLRRLGLPDVELYEKTGRSRRIEVAPGHRRRSGVEVRSEEAGWAVRAGGERGSIFVCGTGTPTAEGPWPEPRGESLQLPPVRPPVAREEPSPPAPLIAEGEVHERLERFEAILAAEVAGARLVRAVVDDGSSEARLRSVRGVDCEQRSRAAALYLEVAAGETRRGCQLAARCVVELDFAALARRFATLLTTGRDGSRVTAGSGPMVLAPAVAVRVLSGLLPLLVGGDGWRFARTLGGRRGRVGSELVTVIDDGGFEGGILRSDTDGEGMPTRAVELIAGGEYRQPLLSWHEAHPGRGEGSGCMLRPSWREPPEPGPTHLYLRREPAVSPASLVGSVGRGFYWLDGVGAASFDLAADRFQLPVCGFRLRDGRATEPISAALVTGGIGALLRGVAGVARDLAFHPRRYLVGSPTLLVEGLRIDGAPPT